ncbi:MAG: Nmad2 family putative nucleotide modification protein [Rhodospirillales bacterium]
MAKIYSYVVARDFGFAPNPFHGVCTLATCKPNIRQSAQRGDWVIGTGSKQYKKKNIEDRLVYCMQIDDILPLNDYWNHEDFQIKKPILSGSKKRQMGDNIYHRENGQWHQENSHHSREDGTENCNNTKKDTGGENVLISRHFTYWGRDAVEIPLRFRSAANPARNIVKSGPGYKSKLFPEDVVEGFTEWFIQEWGFRGEQGKPAEFS